MSSTARANFVQQQGYAGGSPASCSLRYPPLMFQPRVAGVLVLAGVLLQEWAIFAGFGAVLWWCALVPRLNPFEGFYNAVLAERRGRPKLGPAPAPRRFAQALAGTLMLVIGAALLAGWQAVAWGVEAFLVVALGALIFGKFCLGAFLYHHLRGDGAFARRTAPWASGG